MKNKLLLSLSIVVLIVSIESAYAIQPNVIVIYGKMNNSSGETIQMKVHVINNATGASGISLVGKCAMNHRDNSSLPLQYTLFNVQGNMSTNTLVNLAGNVTASTDPTMIGKPISITANTSTGNTTLTFGYSNYTGIEHVLIK